MTTDLYMLSRDQRQNGKAQRAASAAPAVQIATLVVGVGGRGGAAARTVESFIHRQSAGACVQAACVDVWAGDMDQTLALCPPLPEHSRVVLAPIVPAELAAAISSHRDYASVRDRVSPARYIGKTDSTEEGAGAAGEVGFLAGFVSERTSRERLSLLINRLRGVRDRAGSGVRPRTMNLVTLFTPNGAVGYGSGLYYSRLLRSLARGSEYRCTLAVLLGSDCRTDNRQKSRAQEHVLMSRELPEAFACTRRFESHEGPGGMSWRQNVPPADHVLVFDLSAAAEDEATSRIRIAAAVSMLAHPVGDEMRGDLRNSNDTRRDARLIYSTCGVRIVESDPALLVEHAACAAASGALRLAGQELDAQNGRGRADASRWLVTQWGDPNQNDPLTWLSREGGVTLANDALRELDRVARGWVLDGPERGSVAFERDRAAFVQSARNIARNTSDAARRDASRLVREPVLQQLKERVQARRAAGQFAEAHGLVVGVRGWLRDALGALRSGLPVSQQEEQRASQALEALELAACPEPYFAAVEDPEPEAAPEVVENDDKLLGLLLRVWSWFYGIIFGRNSETPAPDEPAPSQQPVSAGVRQLRVQVVRAAQVWSRAYVALRSRQLLAEELEALDQELQLVERVTAALSGQLTGAASVLEQRRQELTREIQERAQAVDLFLPADDEVLHYLLDAYCSPDDLLEQIKRTLVIAAEREQASTEGLAAEQIEAAVRGFFLQRLKPARRPLGELFPELPVGVQGRVASLLGQTSIFARVHAAARNRVQTSGQLSIWAPEGARPVLEHSGALPVDAVLRPSAWNDRLVAFCWVKGLRWADFEQADQCGWAHDEYEDRRALYVDERLMTASDGVMTDEDYHLLLVQARAAGVLTRDRGGFRYAAPDGTSVRLASSLEQLLAQLRRGDGPVRTEALREHVAQFVQRNGAGGLCEAVAELVSQKGALGHPPLQRAARRLLAEAQPSVRLRVA